MSAIFGLVGLYGQEVSPKRLERMDRALTRYGPDAAAIWHQKAAGLGHRLMRFTPQEHYERQPCVNAGGNLILVFDGRIDNRAELIQMLGLAAKDQEDCPDSQLVLQAFQRWGQASPSKLVGPFAFAVWDAIHKTLFAARAPFSAPPFYYHRSSNLLAFATRPKAIFATGLLKREVDPQILADYLVSFPSEAERSFFQGIKLLAPGCCLQLRAGEIKLYAYWRLEDVKPIRHGLDQDYVDAARSLLDRVVADHLRSLSPSAILMSGGLDSASIAGSAALKLRQHAKVLSAFTEVPKPEPMALAPVAGRYFDETLLVRSIADQHENLALTFVHSEGFYLEGIDDFFDAVEHPFRNASNRRWMEACYLGAASQGCHTVLTGTGGNLSLGRSDDDMLTNALQSGHLTQALQIAGETARASGQTSMAREILRAALPLMPMTLRRANQRRRLGWPLLNGQASWRQYSVITRELLEAADVAARGINRGFNFEFATTIPARSLRLLSLQHSQISVNMDRGYRELFHIDLRHPLYDQRLVEFSFGVPEDQFLHRGEPRSLIRRVSTGRLPSAILCNRLRGLQSANWLQNLKAAQPQIEADIDRFGKSPLVSHAIDVPRLRKLASELPAANASNPKTTVLYRSLFEFGLMTGRYLLWVEARA